MRVELVNQVSQVYKPSGAGEKQSADGTSFRDAYEISRQGKDYQVAKQAVSEAPEVREDRVAQLKEALASGTYNVSSQEIAEKMVSRVFDLTV